MKYIISLLLLTASVFAIAGEDAELIRLQQLIKEHHLPFTVGPTSVSDLTLREVTGLKVPEHFNAAPRALPPPPMTALPARFDWRDQGMVSPVKNQRNCGACWAFATVGPMESGILRAGGSTQDLSEQDLISCNPWGYSCDGGFWAFDMFVSPGAVLESCQTYTASSATLCVNCDHPYALREWAYVSSDDMPADKDIKTAILLYGPVAGALHASDALMRYRSGVFTLDEAGDINHAVTIVGWDDSMGPNGAWIIKNSWGTGWGEEGFAYVAYDILQLGYAAAYVLYLPPPGEDAYEPDNTPAEAKPIAVGEVQHHTSVADPDWVKFHLDPGSVYYVYTDNLCSGSDTIIRLYDASGATLLAVNDDYHGDVRYSYLQITPTVPTDYTLMVDQVFGYGPDLQYNLGLEFLRYTLSSPTRRSTPH